MSVRSVFPPPVQSSSINHITDKKALSAPPAYYPTGALYMLRIFPLLSLQDGAPAPASERSRGVEASTPDWASPERFLRHRAPLSGPSGGRRTMRVPDGFVRSSVRPPGCERRTTSWRLARWAWSRRAQAWRTLPSPHRTAQFLPSSVIFTEPCSFFLLNPALTELAAVATDDGAPVDDGSPKGAVLALTADSVPGECFPVARYRFLHHTAVSFVSSDISFFGTPS